MNDPNDQKEVIQYAKRTDNLIPSVGLLLLLLLSIPIVGRGAAAVRVTVMLRAGI